MRLSTKGKYGVEAMLDLAIHYGTEPVSIKSISERQYISECYLEQLFAALRKAKLIKSIRGAQGGYVLTRSPEQINILEIMEVLEGPVEISDCLEDGSCKKIDCCATRLLWMKVKNSINDVLKSETLKDMVADYELMKKNIRTIYMDYSATTFTKKEVMDEMLPYFTDDFGNPSSIYSISRVTKKAIDKARDRVSNAINADSSEIYFTAGGSEGDNWALKGIAFANKDKGNHIITTGIEHHAVLKTCEFLKKNGFEVTYLPVDKNGFVSVQDVKNAITDKTILVSIMFANNEIGTIEPIKEIGKICRERNIYFHTDAVQAIGNVNIDVKEMNIDMLSMSAHKFYGPKGIGAMYIRHGVRIESLIHGGAQERARRAGTENIPGIVGLGKAIELAHSNIDEHIKRLSLLRDKLIDGLLKIPYTKLNGPRGDKRLPGNVNICFKYVSGESLLMLLDSNGICASSGSACSAGSLDPSHVLLAIGLSPEDAKGSLRLSIGDETTENDIDIVLKTISQIVNGLRSKSPS